MRTGLQEVTAIVAVGRGIVKYMRALMGDDAYDRYLEHHGVTHPGVPPQTARDFWRERVDAQDVTPGGRCC